MLNTPLLIVPRHRSFKPFESISFFTTQNEQELDYMLHIEAMFPDTKIMMTHFSITENIKDLEAANWVEYAINKIGDNLKFRILNTDINTYMKDNNLAIQEKREGVVFISLKRNF